MKWVFYNLLFAAVFPFLLPGFLLRMLRRGGYKVRMLDRFGIYPKTIARAPFLESHRYAPSEFVWIHAVSVGEVQVAGQLMREWRKAEPGVRFVFSTTSSTGWKMAEREVTAADTLIYNPLDFPNFVKSAFAAFRPRAVVLTESEIWPVFIRRAQKLGIPLFLINARVSDRSAPRYRLARAFFGDIFNAFTRIFAQSDLDKARLVAAGAPADRIDVTGSFKFDVAHRNPAKEQELREWIGKNLSINRFFDFSNEGRDLSNCKILLGGSTWPGEDKVLLDIYKKLLDSSISQFSQSPNTIGQSVNRSIGQFPILILAPRHFEKADQVEANIRAAGFDCIRRSRGDAPAPDAAHEARSMKHVFLADTTGELMGLYGIADFVFVGKSLCEHGSQNMIEPCLCGKPTVVGPFTENFRPVMSDLSEGRGIVQVKDAAELERVILGWFADERDAAALGERASAAVRRRLGVVPRSVEFIRDALAKGVTPPRRRRASVFDWLCRLATVALVGWLIASSFESVDDFADLEAAVRYRPLETAKVFTALVENPSATNVALAVSSKSREFVASLFALSGMNVESIDDSRKYPLVYATDDRRRSVDLAELGRHVESNGVLALALDVRGMSAQAFNKVLDDIPGEELHLWIPGEHDWLLVTRPIAAKVSLDAAGERFLNENSFAELAKASIDGPADLFANYVGRGSEIMPGFLRMRTDEQVKIDNFLSVELPSLDWIEPGELDDDIYAGMMKSIGEKMAVRRLVVIGNQLAANGEEEKSLDAWSEAYRKNPGDMLLNDRLYRLAVNAHAFERVGNLKGAAKCYETMLSVKPKDAAALLKYAECLRSVGQKSAADEIVKKAKEIIQ